MAIPSEQVLKSIIKERVFPASFLWSRLEGRPLTKNFDRALKAEVRDALWMLTKQWQMGEFEGEDAGSPLSAKLCTSTSRLDKYRAGEHHTQLFETDIPLEAKVEQRMLPLSIPGQNMSLDLRLLMGRRWMQFLKEKGLDSSPVRHFFLDHYKIKSPDPSEEGDAALCAHPEVWQQFAAVSGRMMDGGKLYLDLKAHKAPHYYDLADFPVSGRNGEFDAAETRFLTWFEELFTQPVDPENDAWNPLQLEYQFAVSTPGEQGEKVMTAAEYYQGHLDWYNLDVASQVKSLGNVPDAPPRELPERITLLLIPTPVVFEGMPNARWWAFEDSRVNFSYIKPDTSELAKLLLIEFGLVYANDWYLVPYQLPVGSLTGIKGMTLTNVFGENFWIEAAGRGDDRDWTRWNMFSLKVTAEVPSPADLDLLLLPTVPKIQEGKPAEEVVFIRDEMANMVWGVETIVPLPSGRSKSGYEAATEFHNYLQKLADDKPVAPSLPSPVVTEGEPAKIRYQVMTPIPENWIPFVPAHVPDSNREVQLQRAAMPRIIEGNTQPPDKVRPRTQLLQEGLADRKPYFIHEEEVPRAGIRVRQLYQRTRWTNGKVFVWYGVRKTTGRGEGSSGLGFDHIVDNNIS